MKKQIVFVLVIISLLSCNKKDLKVPKVAMAGAEKVANHSTIWMFYNEEKGIDVNEKNRISSTNWFFNIDKKVSLNSLVPEVIRLVDKHNTKSPHNTKPMQNYFTYINSLNDHLSFYQIDSINFKIIDKKNLPIFKSDTVLVHVKSPTGLKLPIIEKNTIVQTAFDSKMSFQEYFETKALFNKMIKLENRSSIEYIINP